MNLLHDGVPPRSALEITTLLLTQPGLRVERIVSYGQSSPQDFWYDQEEHEWVLVLSGWGCVEFEDGRTFTLQPGDYLEIPAHQRHRVQATSPAETTIWLALFYR